VISPLVPNAVLNVVWRSTASRKKKLSNVSAPTEGRRRVLQPDFSVS
jgi:hypothetical protein